MRYVIVGGGVIGTTIGLALARKKAGEITILEKENSIGQHASGRNSGVIHSGINQKPGSLKAKMCLEGSRRLREYCQQRRVSMVECGTLVVARDAKDLEVLERLKEMGAQCGVPALALIGRDELSNKEPSVQGIAALSSPTGATVDSLSLLLSLAADAKAAGVKYHLYEEVKRIEEGMLVTNRGSVKADHVINCAGLHADEIAHCMGAGQGYRVIPFRGEYMEVKGCELHGMVYQAPDLRFPFLSIHLTRETDGRVLAGPSAVLSFGREAYDKQWQWHDALDMFFSRPFLRLVTSREFLGVALRNARLSLSKRAFLEEIQKLAPGVKMEQLSPARSGIRAQMVDAQGRMVEDIVVEYRKDSTHVLNAVSPGMTCSLAFADHVVENITGNLGT